MITQYALATLERQGMLSARFAIAWPEAYSLETAKQRKAVLQEKWYAGEISDGEYFSLLTREETEIKRLVTEQQAWLVRHHSGARAGLDTQVHWGRLSLGEKREVLRVLLESVIILPGTKGSHRFDPTAVVPVWRATTSASSAA